MIFLIDVYESVQGIYEENGILLIFLTCSSRAFTRVSLLLQVGTNENKTVSFL